MKVKIDQVDVDVERITHDEETLESTYKVVGTIDGVSVNGTVTLFEGSDFEHELGCDDEHIVRIFEHIDGIVA